MQNVKLITSRCGLIFRWPEVDFRVGALRSSIVASAAVCAYSLPRPSDHGAFALFASATNTSSCFLLETAL